MHDSLFVGPKLSVQQNFNQQTICILQRDVVHDKIPSCICFFQISPKFYVFQQAEHNIIVKSNVILH